MNDEHDLDRLIDEAARQMAQHEPPDALSITVMARVAADRKSFRQPWLAWGSVAAAVAVAGVVIAVGVNRTATDSRLRTPDSGLPIADSHQARELVSNLRAPEPEARSLEPVGRPAPAAAFVADLAAAEIDDPIAFESITPAPIEVERLEVITFATIIPIEIAPIEIAPISTSDD